MFERGPLDFLTIPRVPRRLLRSVYHRPEGHRADHRCCHRHLDGYRGDREARKAALKKHGNERLPPLGRARAKLRASSMVSGRCSAIDFRPSHLCTCAPLAIPRASELGHEYGFLKL